MKFFMIIVFILNMFWTRGEIIASILGTLCCLPIAYLAVFIYKKIKEKK